MFCTRCNTIMFPSSHVEEERIGNFVLLTAKFNLECPLCGILKLKSVPGLTPQQLEKH